MEFSEKTGTLEAISASGESDRQRAYWSPAVQPRRNPDFRRKGVPGSTELSAGREQPHYLYTLTPVGEQRRKFLLALAENDANHLAALTEGPRS